MFRPTAETATTGCVDALTLCAQLVLLLVVLLLLVVVLLLLMLPDQSLVHVDSPYSAQS